MKLTKSVRAKKHILKARQLLRESRAEIDPWSQLARENDQIAKLLLAICSAFEIRE